MTGVPDPPAGRDGPGRGARPGAYAAPAAGGHRRAPTVALVLGSGGARGYAHIGVLQVLEAAGLEVVAVAGSSMGALVGGLYAAGQLERYTEWATGLSQFEVLRLMDVSLSASGAIRGDRIFRVVSDILGERAIEELPVAFTAVAVDLLAHREVWFQEGPLDMAIRASSAIPSFMAPVILNGRVLVDGGVLNPVPVAPVTATHADLVVAVSLNGRGGAPAPPVAESAREEAETAWSSRLKGTAARWFDSDLLGVVRRRLSAERQETVRARLATDEPPEQPRRAGKAPSDERLGAVEVMQASLDVMQGALTRHRLAAYAPDVLVSVPKNACRTLDFHRAGELIDLGRRLAEDALADVVPGTD